MVLSSDGTLLAVGRENKSIEIWKTDTFAQLLVIPGHKNVDLRSIHWLEPEATKKASKGNNPLYYDRLKGGKTL
jgi:WD40 repeat protein